MEHVDLTHHGVKRGKQRAGLDRGALEKTAAKAKQSGVVAGDTTGRLRRYLDGKLTEHKGTTCYIYGNHIFCFGGDVLITVLELPHELRRSALSAAKKKSSRNKS